ncbi:hypothetical protein DV737_g5754, partial [Chaetothyriales sp. CBS 132003]
MRAKEPELDRLAPRSVTNLDKPRRSRGYRCRAPSSLAEPSCTKQPRFSKNCTHIHRFPYLLTAGDVLRLPFHLHGVSPGDVLRFNRASVLGSRDYTLKAGLGSHSEEHEGKGREPRYLDERLFECRVRVMGVESQPMGVKEKTKRRNRKVKTVRSKHKYTVCRVMEVRVKGVDELMQEKGVVVLE